MRGEGAVVEAGEDAHSRERNGRDSFERRRRSLPSFVYLACLQLPRRVAAVPCIIKLCNTDLFDVCSFLRQASITACICVAFEPGTGCSEPSCILLFALDRFDYYWAKDNDAFVLPYERSQRPP